MAAHIAAQVLSHVRACPLALNHHLYPSVNDAPCQTNEQQDEKPHLVDKWCSVCRNTHCCSSRHVLSASVQDMSRYLVARVRVVASGLLWVRPLLRMHAFNQLSRSM
jgi:hypothetical protein